MTISKPETPAERAALAATLSSYETFQNVPLDQLLWLIERGEMRCYAEGDTLFKAGDPITHMYIMLDGLSQFKLEQNGQFREVFELTAGEVGGTLPFSRTNLARGYGIFEQSSQLLFLHRDNFKTMAHECYELTEALVHVMSNRVREFTAQQQQTDKMASLGRMSAGLAHELNNPSAAIVRSASELKQNLAQSSERFKRVMLLNITPDAVDVCNALFVKKAETAGSSSLLSTLEKADAEEELMTWLEDHSIESAFEMTGNLVDFGFTTGDLDYLLANVGNEALFTVLEWLDNTLMTERFVSDIGEASKRINDIVSAVKSYSHLDRSNERQCADLHVGIQNTFMILMHKIKKLGITVEKNFDLTLPEVCVYVGELNQVWTNLLDNAIDAMEAAPVRRLEVITRRHKDDGVEVCIIDTGAGIPADVLANIFDPFFTTKPMGKGTGLGLTAVQTIIKKHDGTLKVLSEPGRTEFCVCLPLEA